MLNHLGHEIVLASDGDEAIRIYWEHHESGQPFDMAILDLTIPGGMGGAEAGETILEAFPQAKIIVTSGYSTDPILANFREHGFSGGLAKPMQLNDLGKVIDSVRKKGRL